MVKNKRNKKGKASKPSASNSTTNSNSTTDNNNNNNNNNNATDTNTNITTNTTTTDNSTNTNNTNSDLDNLLWLRECELRRDANGEPCLQLEYQPDDTLIQTLHQFLAQSQATKQVVNDIYQIWQQTVLSTLLASSALWKKENVTAQDQRLMKEHLKLARYKLNFMMHHTVGAILTSQAPKWILRKHDVLHVCLQTLQLLPRLAESCPHHPTDLRQTILHFEGKEFLAAAACETWDTLYDYAVPLEQSPIMVQELVPSLRRCAMLDILDKDWNMLGGWEDILKGLETKCFPSIAIRRLPADALLHEQTTIWRNARNSMQCKFFSIRFMRYTQDQAPQRWRYFPKCSAPACANLETPDHPHKHRCRKCWYFHYCSLACQEYSDNIMGLHPKFCTDTPKNKAASCQKETYDYLGWTVPGENDPLVCHACGSLQQQGQMINGNDSSTNSNSNNSSTMKRCQQCKMVCYCSRQCQQWDWTIGGHSKVCKATARVDSSNDNNDVTTEIADLN